MNEECGEVATPLIRQIPDKIDALVVADVAALPVVYADIFREQVYKSPLTSFAYCPRPFRGRITTGHPCSYRESLLLVDCDTSVLSVCCTL